MSGGGIKSTKIKYPPEVLEAIEREIARSNRAVFWTSEKEAILTDLFYKMPSMNGVIRIFKLMYPNEKNTSRTAIENKIAKMGLRKEDDNTK